MGGNLCPPPEKFVTPPPQANFYPPPNSGGGNVQGGKYFICTVRNNISAHALYIYQCIKHIYI